MSSTNGLVGEAEFAHYNAAKFGVVGLTMTMAIELAPHAINVNAVCPGLIRTVPRMILLPGGSLPRNTARKFRWGVLPCRMRSRARFSFSPRTTRFITGTTLVVDGGQLTF